MFGDKKTMYCHHIKGAEGPTVRLMAEAGKKSWNCRGGVGIPRKEPMLWTFGLQREYWQA